MRVFYGFVLILQQFTLSPRACGANGADQASCPGLGKRPEPAYLKAFRFRSLPPS